MASFRLTYSSIPFISDVARTIRAPNIPTRSAVESDTQNTAPRKHQPMESFLEELDRLMPFCYLEDYGVVGDYPGKNLGAIARLDSSRKLPSPEVKIGDWYYPYGACRWSVFRGLATSSQAKEMLKVAGGTGKGVPNTFVMECLPTNVIDFGVGEYTLQSQMYMLPPRCIGEHGGLSSKGMDGLYLVTLVDERYWWQYASSYLRVDKDTTWLDLIGVISKTLGVTIDVDVISPSYSKPEPDSQLWSNMENLAVVLDAIAYNIGMTVVRNLDGSYHLYRTNTNLNIAKLNRGNPGKVARVAGGDLFVSGGNLAIGNLGASKNLIIPDSVQVTFPKYIVGDDPVPHFVNTRYQNQRPSAWYEDSYGDVHTVEVTLSFLNQYNASSGLLSGLGGVPGYSYTIHTTAKARYPSETLAASGMIPDNYLDINNLAIQSALDYYDYQTNYALDETLPGTFAWRPEGIHDIIWSYSPSRRLACTRVMKSQWNRVISETQHSAPAFSGTSVPKGVGGKSVAQSWRDSFSGSIVGAGAPSTTLIEITTSPITMRECAHVNFVDYFPTQNRWRGIIDQERFLFEGTSGQTYVDIVYRGIDGSFVATHGGGSLVSQIIPDTTYGVNLVTFEKMMFSYPQEWTSGGIQGVNIVPQVQTVEVTTQDTTTINGVKHWQGKVELYDATQSSGSQFPQRENVWLVERNANFLTRNRKYEGQLAGYSASGPVQPVYLVNDTPSLTSGPSASGIITSGMINYSGCAAVVVTERFYECTSGINNEFIRYLTISQIGNCLTSNYSSWEFSKTNGCCACTGSGSGSITPGCDCVQQPSQFNFYASGFGGSCYDYNGGWILEQVGACTWQGFGGNINNPRGPATLTIVPGVNNIGISGETYTLTIEGVVVYQAFHLGSDCCQVVTLNVLDQGPCNFHPASIDVVPTCPASPGSGCNSCAACVNGITPPSWSVVISGIPAPYEAYNRTWVLSQTTPFLSTCAWKASSTDTDGLGHTLQVLLSIGALLLPLNNVVLFLGDVTVGGYIPYQNSVAAQNCCQNIVVKAAAGLPPDFPASFTLVPDCSPCTGGSGSGSGSGSGGNTVLVPCCPSNLLPATVYATWTTAVIGGYPWLPLSIPLVYDGAVTWNSVCYNDGTGQSIKFSLVCTALTNQFKFSVGDGGISPTPSAQSCSPFLLSFGEAEGNGFASPNCVGGVGGGVDFSSVTVSS